MERHVVQSPNLDLIHFDNMAQLGHPTPADVAAVHFRHGGCRKTLLSEAFYPLNSTVRRLLPWTLDSLLWPLTNRFYSRH